MGMNLAKIDSTDDRTVSSFGRFQGIFIGSITNHCCEPSRCIAEFKLVTQVGFLKCKPLRRGKQELLNHTINLVSATNLPSSLDILRYSPVIDLRCGYSYKHSFQQNRRSKGYNTTR